MRQHNVRGVSARPFAKMKFEQFTELAKDLKKDPNYLLVNRDLRNGTVYFSTDTDLKVLTSMIEYRNTGRLPESVILKMKVSQAKMEKLGFSMVAWSKSLEKLKGPDSGGFYQARCPSCAKRGGDSDSNHLVYTLEGVVHCYAGCKFFDIIAGYYKEDSL